ncbi:MAG: carbohydrate binding family 9 domain-containing protein, partial [Bacteroidales bacterium]|nr:carbohydrate binding family 9 domain-containing protein [Bacteroidales bacterium]
MNFKTGLPYRSVFTFLIFFTFIYPLPGQDPIVIKKIEENIVFDGLPFEDIWNEVEPFPVVMFQPNYGREPTEKTEIRLCYNDQYLFVSGRLYDKDPSKIKSATKKRDDFGGNSDGFGIILDTFDDNENALLFATTPVGLRSDFMIFNDAVGRMNHMPFNISWNTFWDVKTVINEEGWFVEIRIPISSLRFQDIDGITTMGLIVWRSIPHKNETIIFPAIHPKYGIWAMMKPSQAQKIVFNSIKPEKPVYIAPYALSGISEVHEMNEEETAYIKDNKPTLEGGLDIKYGLRSNITLDLTLNTDFAQVEADDEQVNLTRFSLFFPEKRLFFQERSSNFSFNLGGPSNLFYSRRIGIYDGKPVRIYGGARIVGRAGKWDIGLLDMQTAPVWERDSIGQKQKVLPSENFGILRLRRQVINPNSYVGGILTSRMGTNGSYNYAYGLDGIFRLFGDDYLDIKWAQSFETDSLNDPISLKP